MILVDTSVWIDHFRQTDADLASLLQARLVVCHPFVIGELACGHLPRRPQVLASLAGLPLLPLAAHDEVLSYVERHRLMARGIGWVDMHLMASATIAGRMLLWSRDRRLAAAADELGFLHRVQRH